MPEQRVSEAKKLGFKRCIVPAVSMKTIGKMEGIETVSYTHLDVYKRQGTYLCWVDLKAYVSEENIKDMIQKKCRLAVDYGDWFGGERFGTHIRINLATSHENVKIAVDALVDNI